MTIDRKLFASLALSLLIASPTVQAQTPPPEYLDQGWNESQRQSWYTTSQGSRLLPHAWFLALELAGSGEKLAAPSNMRRYGYLENFASGASLPIGFAVDTGPSPDKSTVPWVGMTCAACHTGEMTYKGKRFRVDGAPTLADFETFMEDFTAALKATNEEPAKFDRFAAEVLGSQPAPGKPQLKAELQVQADWYVKLAEKNRSSVRYGHGRLDAQGHILNKVSLIVGVPQQLPDYPSDAPASYPYLWYTPKQERVQWNGLVKQDFGGMPRNIGQVVGVFAAIDVATSDKAYPSSVRRANLGDLERLAEALKPPSWPENILPKIGPVGDGKELFRDYCSRCHTSIDRASGDKVESNQALAQMKPLAEIGTDIWLACNTFQHLSRSGHLQGRPGDIEGHIITAEDKTSFMLTNIVAIIWLGPEQPPPPPPPAGPITAQGPIPKQLLFGSRHRTALQRGTPMVMSGPFDPKSQRETDCRDASKKGDETLAYKAGPLNGIWATAPYLHNGSVPTLDDLLQPASKRPVTFRVGSTQFDPDRVGFTTQEGPFEFRVRDASGKVIPGNDNAGHDGREYGTLLNETQRKALLEYLKSL